MTKPLRASLRAPRCTVPRFDSLADALKAVAAGRHDLRTTPFITTWQAGIKGFDAAVRRHWSQPALTATTNVTLQYYSPHQAKLRRQHGEAPGGDETLEVFKPEMLSFQQYFERCYGSKLRSGYSTEHCAQTVPLRDLLRAAGDDKGAAAVEAVMADGFDGMLGVAEAPEHSLSIAAQFERRKRDAVQTAWDALVETSFEGNDKAEKKQPKIMEDELKMQWLAEQAADADSRYLSIGSSGSGEQLQLPSRQRPRVEAQLRGQRRHLLMSVASYTELKRRAGDDFNPTAAFSFFEAGYEEATEEWGLGNEEQGLGVYECNQVAGEVLYFPGTVARVSLALEDSLAVGREASAGAENFAAHVENSVWSPAEGRFNLAICLKSSEIGQLPGWPEQHKAAYVKQVASQLDQGYSTAISKTPTLLSVLLDCATLRGATGRAAADVDPENASVCDFALEHCRNALAASLHDLGFKEWPAWIAQNIGGTPKGDSKKKLKQSRKKKPAKKKKTKKKKTKKPLAKKKKKGSKKNTGKKKASSEFDEL